MESVGYYYMTDVNRLSAMCTFNRYRRH